MRTIQSIFLLLFSSTVFGQVDNQPTRINVDEIGKSVVLIGRLGKPLGTRVRIKGVWEFPGAAKDMSIRFRVTEIDGKRLEEKMEFSISQIQTTTEAGKDLLPSRDRRETLKGQVWTLTAYETGSIEIFPADLEKPRFYAQDKASAYFIRPFTSKLISILVSADELKTP